MAQFQRSQAQALCDLSEACPGFMVAILGRRRTGETTIMRQTLEKSETSACLRA